MACAASVPTATKRFCRALAQENGVPFMPTCGQGRDGAAPGGVSTQELAREIRYRFFSELCREHGFTHIATAHQTNDSAETFFVNLLRGTGIQGLGGIPAQNGRVVRPASGFYPRGTGKPGHRKPLGLPHGRFQRKGRLPAQPHPPPRVARPGTYGGGVLGAPRAQHGPFGQRIALCRMRLLAQHFAAHAERTDKAALSAFPKELWPTVLFKRFAGLGLTYSQPKDLAEAWEGMPGKQFLTPTHRLLVDRAWVSAEPLPVKTEEETVLFSRHRHLARLPYLNG